MITAPIVELLQCETTMRLNRGKIEKEAPVK
jgi:hypothetical protein